MAPNPPPNRKRGRPSNASLGLPPRSRNPAQPRKSSGPSDPGAAAKKRKSGGRGGRLSVQNNKGQAAQRKQSTIRESWSTSSRRDARSDDDEEEDEDGEEEEEEDYDSARAKKRRRRRSSNAPPHRSSLGGTGVIGRRGVPQPNQPGSHGRQDKDKRQDQEPPDGEASSAAPSPPKPYVHVAPYARRVRQSAIEAKWSPLANASLTAVTNTLQHAQRPILQRLSDSQLRREYTSSALRLITHRIARKISRGLPFPPASMPANVGRAPLQSDGGREVELNFESVLDGELNLERQLEPALDGLEVLRREKEAMEEELELDYETLRNLEAGARAQAREQRSLLRKAHVLTPAPANSEGETTARDDKMDGFELTRDEDAASGGGGAFTEIDDDDDIQPLAVQLGTHVDNIRANLEQTDGLMPQLARSRAALRAVLLRHLDLRRYEQVVLG